MSDLISFSAEEVAIKITAELRGNKELRLLGISPSEFAESNSVTFFKGGSPVALLKILERCNQVCIITSIDSDKVGLSDQLGTNTLLVVPVPFVAVLDLVPLFYPSHEVTPIIHATAQIAPDAVIGKRVSIGAGSVIKAKSIIGDDAVIHENVVIYEDVTIGKGVTLHSGVAIRERCTLGDSVCIHNNSVIGADGFGYIPDEKIGLRKVPQVGGVTIGSGVEIGANSCIDRGAFGNTRIGDGTKIDNQVQIGHNTIIGKHCVLCGHVAIGGSSIIEDGVILAGKVGVADHMHIVSGVRVGGGTVVTTSLKEPGDYVGYPAAKALDWRRMQVSQRQILKSKR